MYLKLTPESAKLLKDAGGLMVLCPVSYDGSFMEANAPAVRNAQPGHPSFRPYGAGNCTT
jgi:hypothetical protein